MNYKQTKRPMKKNIFILFITFQTYSFGQGEQPLRPMILSLLGMSTRLSN